jgi:hypothetical protein
MTSSEAASQIEAAGVEPTQELVELLMTAYDDGWEAGREYVRGQIYGALGVERVDFAEVADRRSDAGGTVLARERR